jgi:hypothetical protein
MDNTGTNTKSAASIKDASTVAEAHDEGWMLDKAIQDGIKQMAKDHMSDIGYQALEWYIRGGNGDYIQFGEAPLDYRNHAERFFKPWHLRSTGSYYQG